MMHWLNAVAIITLIGTGWQIYNPSPFLPFPFPAWATIGQWLGGAMAPSCWHNRHFPIFYLTTYLARWDGILQMYTCLPITSLDFRLGVYT